MSLNEKHVDICWVSNSLSLANDGPDWKLPQLFGRMWIKCTNQEDRFSSYFPATLVSYNLQGQCLGTRFNPLINEDEQGVRRCTLQN